MVIPRSWWAMEPSSPVSLQGPGHIVDGQCGSLISYIGWRELRVDPVTSLLVGIGETPVPWRSGAGTGLWGLAYGVKERPLYLMCVYPIHAALVCMQWVLLCARCECGQHSTRSGLRFPCTQLHCGGREEWQRCPCATGVWLFRMALPRGQ